MNWLIFFIGVLVGWLVELIVDFVFWRKRYQGSASEARLRIELAGLEAKASHLEAKLAGCQDGQEDVAAVTELQTCNEALEQSNDRLSALESEIESLQTALADAKTELQEPVEVLHEAQIEVVERTASVIEAALVVPDDLRKVEGIGPKIAGILNEQGIQTFVQLAETDVARLKQILGEAGKRYAMANPTTWPEQARLAATGDWDAVKVLQSQLKGGRRKLQ